MRERVLNWVNSFWKYIHLWENKKVYFSFMNVMMQSSDWLWSSQPDLTVLKGQLYSSFEQKIRLVQRITVPDFLYLQDIIILPANETFTSVYQLCKQRSFHTKPILTPQESAEFLERILIRQLRVELKPTNEKLKNLRTPFQTTAQGG